MGKSIQRDIYYEKMKNKAEITGQSLAVLMMASRFKKHHKYAVEVLNNAKAALAAAGAEVPDIGITASEPTAEYAHTRTV